MNHAALSSLSLNLQKTIDFLHAELGALQVGHASPTLVENISIPAYGSPQPMKNLASIVVDGGQSLVITPWDKGLLNTIEKAIRDEPGLGLSPVNNGAGIRLNIPPLTQERRKELTKIVSKMGEESKITIRKNRHEALDAMKKDETLSEDMQKAFEKEMQKQIDKANESVDASVKKKQEDVMKI